MKQTRVLVLFAVVVATIILGILILAPGATEMVEFARNKRSMFLLYAHLSNRIRLVGQGETVSIDPDGPDRYLSHHAHPTLSPDGNALAFVRQAPDHGSEELLVYDRATHKEKVVLTWPGSIWSLSWSPKSSLLAMVADKSGSSRLI